MGDANTELSQHTVTENQSQSDQKQSVDLLRETKPAPDISINAADPPEPAGPQEKEKTPEKEAPMEKEAASPSPANIETVFEKLDTSSDKSDSTIESMEEKKAPQADYEVRDCHKTDKQASDIFSLKEVEKGSKNINSIWSISGAPSGRLNRRKDVPSSVFPVGCMGCKEQPVSEEPSPRRFLDAVEASNDYIGHLDDTPKKRCSSSKSRNPVTGAGCEEEATRTNSRKKDGNPVTGVGYEESPAAHSPSGRVPPGGYSKGLW